MTIILILSTSVSAFGLSAVEWEIVDYITNIQFSSQNCVIVKYNTSTPTPSMTDNTGAYKAQKTTYNVLLSLYETVTTDGAHFAQNNFVPGVFHWYQYGGYCWIKFDADEDTNTYWVGNYSGKILYCEAPDDGDSYTISAIAGSTYYLTDREPGTVGSGYAGDYQVSKESAQNISSALSNLGSSAMYYSVVRSIDGETRYYLSCMYPNRSVYYVCNSVGQLYYSVKETVSESGDDSGGDGTSGEVFDDSEIIAALNSVYDALDSGFYDVCAWLDILKDGIYILKDSVEDISYDVLMLSQNVVNGFSQLSFIGEQIDSDIVGLVLDFADFRTGFDRYFKGLGKSYGEYVTVELSGEDNLVEWSDGDVITSVSATEYSYNQAVIVSPVNPSSGANGNPTVEILNVDRYGYEFDYDTSGLFIESVAPMGYDRYVNANQVLNADFRSPQNSNGKRSYSEAGLTIDDWRIYGSNGVLTVADGYINYNVSVNSGYCRLYQPLDIDFEIGETYTVSALVRVNSCTGTPCFRVCNGSTGLVGFTGTPRFNFTSSSGLALYSTTFTNTTNFYDNARFEFLVTPDCAVDIDIYAVKVEVGSQQTLAFEDYGGTWCLFSDDYTPSKPVELYIDNERYKLSTTLSFCGNKHDRIFYDDVAQRWNVYRYASDLNYVLPVADQKVLNKTFVSSISFGSNFPISTVLALVGTDGSGLFDDGMNNVSVPDDVVITMEYYHSRTWFEHMYENTTNISVRLNEISAPITQMADAITLITDDYLAMIYASLDEGLFQKDVFDNYTSYLSMIYDRLGDIEDAVVDAGNIDIDISTDNDAFNIFYIEKSDGTTESVGETATETAKIVGEFLSVFYRLIFADGMENADIIHDFESVYSTDGTGVNVW